MLPTKTIENIQAQKRVKFPSDDGLKLRLVPSIQCYYLMVTSDSDAKNRTSLKFVTDPTSGEIEKTTEFRNDGNFSIEQNEEGTWLMSDSNSTPAGFYNVFLYPCPM